MKFGVAEKQSVPEEEDIHSWVLNHLPLSSEQKWNLICELQKEKQNVNEPEKVPNCEPIENKPLALDE